MKNNMSNVVEMKNGNEELFNAVIGNLKPFGLMKGKENLLSSGMIPLSLCFVDERYQGLREHKHIKRLIKNWDIRKLSPIILVPHYEDYSFAIVDGQGRSIAAKELGYDSLQAIILMDAPTNPKERLKFEAEYFIGQDDECEGVKPLEKHLARVIIGDKPAIILDKLSKKYKFSFANMQGKRTKSILGSYTDTYAIAKSCGKDCLEFIFSIIENAGWNNETNGYATFVMRSLKNIWVAHVENRKEIHKYLSKKLRQMDPELFSANGRAYYPKRDHRKACCLFLEDMICKGLEIEPQIYAEDNKIIIK